MMTKKDIQEIFESCGPRSISTDEVEQVLYASGGQMKAIPVREREKWGYKGPGKGRRRPPVRKIYVSEKEVR